MLVVRASTPVLLHAPFSAVPIAGLTWDVSVPEREIKRTPDLADAERRASVSVCVRSPGVLILIKSNGANVVTKYLGRVLRMRYR